MNLNLIPNWKEGWKFLSAQCMTLAGSVQAAWLAIPDDMKSSVPSWTVHVLTIALLAAGIFGRFVKQSNVADS